MVLAHQSRIAPPKLAAVGFMPEPQHLERAALISKHRNGREQRVAANPETLHKAATLLAAFEQQWIKRATKIAEILAEEDAGT